MLRPGTLLRDAMDGRRGKQVKPLLMMVVMAAVVALLNRVALTGAHAGCGLALLESG